MYECTKNEGSEDPFFYFNTERELTYYVGFTKIPNENYPLNNMYSLHFGEVDNKKQSSDGEISATILDLIIKFLDEDDSRVIHYLCESQDKRQVGRQRLFFRWFSLCDKEKWSRYDYEFSNCVDYKLSFIYNLEKYDTQLMESEILLTLDVYERAKP